MKTFFSLYVLLVIVFFVIIIFLEVKKPDNYFFELVISKQYENDRRIEKLKQRFAREKIKLFGFSDRCNLYSKSQVKYPAIYNLSASITEDTDKSAILNAIEDLSKLGCSVNEYNKETGLLPIHNAIVWGDIELLELLLELGADINLVPKRRYHLDAINFTEMIIKAKKDKGQPHVKQDRILERLKVTTQRN